MHYLQGDDDAGRDQRFVEVECCDGHDVWDYAAIPPWLRLTRTRAPTGIMHRDVIC